MDLRGVELFVVVSGKISTLPDTHRPTEHERLDCISRIRRDYVWMVA